MFIRDLGNGRALVSCVDCKQEMEIAYNEKDSGIFKNYMDFVYSNTRCDKCDKIFKEKKRKEKEEERKRELLDSLTERLKNAQIPNFVIKTDVPPKQTITDFFKTKIKTNLLISGETGTGKTTSACFALKDMLKNDYESIYYLTRSQLLNKFVEIKTSPQKDITSYINRLLAYDNLIIDELVGRAGDVEIPPASQEFLFDIIDNVYNLNANCTLWILGNFYKGSISSMFSNPKPLIRRLAEAFESYIIYEDQTIKSIKLA
jgi:DNA replication protein DnaC